LLGDVSLDGGSLNFGGVAKGRFRFCNVGSCRSVNSMTRSVSISIAECNESYFSARVCMVAAVWDD
jgi:hypothetical protein